MLVLLRVSLIVSVYSEQGTPTLLLEILIQTAKLAVSQFCFSVKSVIPK